MPAGFEAVLPSVGSGIGEHSELEGRVAGYSTLVVPSHRDRATGHNWAGQEALDICRVHRLRLDHFDPVTGALGATSREAQPNLEFMTNSPNAGVRGNTRIKVQGEGGTDFLVAELSRPESPYPLTSDAMIQCQLRDLQALSLVGVLDPHAPSPDVIVGALEAIDPGFQQLSIDSNLHLLSVLSSQDAGSSLIDFEMTAIPDGTLISVNIVGPDVNGTLCQRSMTVESALQSGPLLREQIFEITKAVMSGDPDRLFWLVLNP